MYKDKVTLLIQGPMHPNAVVMMQIHSANFNVIFSTWRSEDEELVENSLKDIDFTRVVFSNMSSLPHRNNEQNRFYQFFTTYQGLKMVETEYVIKVRSDEYYTDLRPLVDKMFLEPSKLVTNDVFFRNPFTLERLLLTGRGNLICMKYSRRTLQLFQLPIWDSTV